MLFKLRGTMKGFTTDITDMALGSVRIMPELVMIVEELLAAHNVLAL